MSAYLMIALMIMASGSIIGWVLPNMMEIEIFGIILLTVYRRIRYNNFYISKNNFLALVMILCVFLLNILLTSSGFEECYQMMALIISLWFFSEGMTKEEFSEKLINAMVFLGGASVLFWFLAKFGMEFGAQTISVEGLGHYRLNLLYIYRSTLEAANVIYLNNRNSGIFWEPGAFQGYLNLAILFLVTTKDRFNKINVVKLLVLIIAVLTTMSTSGYFALLLSLVVWYLKKIDNKFHKKHLLLFVVVLIVIGVVMSLPVVQDKFDIENISYSARLNDNVSGVMAVFDEPLFGLGFNSERYYEVLEGYGIIANSSGLLMVFQEFGIMVGLFWVVYTFKNLNKITQQKGWALIVLVAFFLLEMSTEPFFTKPVYTILLFSFHQDDIFNFKKRIGNARKRFVLR